MNYNDSTMLGQKWKVFLVTFCSYACIHSSRTAWSSLKYPLTSPPFSFSPVFLGTLDMIVVLSLAFSLNIFGPSFSSRPKKHLMRGIILLAVVLFLIGILLHLEVSSHIPYLLLYPLVGVASCVGWPSCIMILAQYFPKGMVFSWWNGSTQLGEILTLMISFLFISEQSLNPGYFLFLMSCLLIICLVLDSSTLTAVKQAEKPPLPEESPVDQHPQNLVEQQFEPPAANNESMGDRKQSSSSSATSQTPINFISVWKLPGVASYILSFIFVQAVNSVVVSWIVFYLSMIGMADEARIIAVFWACSTFTGGILGTYFNPTYNPKFFIISLLISSVLFIFLEEIHHPNQIEIIALIVASGLSFGAPFTVMRTSIPLLLSEKRVIMMQRGSKAALISTMEGYGMLFCGISLLIIPSVGVLDLHWVASAYCFLAALILLYAQIKRIKEEYDRKRYEQHHSEPVIKNQPEKQKVVELSAPVIPQKADVGRKRRGKRSRKPVATDREKKEDTEQKLGEQDNIDNEKEAFPPQQASPRSQQEFSQVIDSVKSEKHVPLVQQALPPHQSRRSSTQSGFGSEVT